MKAALSNTLAKAVALILCMAFLLTVSGTAVLAGEESQKDDGYVTITDHADREVTVPLEPERVIILDILPLPSVLTVFLGSAETILAMEPASMNAAKNGILSELFPEVLDVNTEIMSGDDVNSFPTRKEEYKKSLGAPVVLHYSIKPWVLPVQYSEYWRKYSQLIK